MNGLVLKLGPGERVLINGAVVRNGDRRARLTLLTPDVHVLRLRDAIHPDDANTPVKRVCYALQLVVAGEVAPGEALAQVLDGVAQLRAAFVDADSRATLDAAAREVRRGRFYPALRLTRGLIAREELLLGYARARAQAR